MKRLALAVVLMCGCDGFVLVNQPTDPKDPKSPVVVKPISGSFDTAAAADELASWAADANDSVAEDASEVIDGMLRLAGDRKKLPDAFIKKVRDAVPGIGAKPPRDLTADEVSAIRNVR